MIFSKAQKADSGIEVREIPMPCKVDSMSENEVALAYAYADAMVAIEQQQGLIDHLKKRLAHILQVVEA